MVCMVIKLKVPPVGGTKKVYSIANVGCVSV